MSEIIRTPEVLENLKGIVEYISRDNLTAALRWLDEIEAVFALLAAQPGIGERILTRRFGEVRRHVVGNYLLYYRPFERGAEILLVVHGARQQGRLLERSKCRRWLIVKRDVQDVFVQSGNISRATKTPNRLSNSRVRHERQR